MPFEVSRGSSPAAGTNVPPKMVRGGETGGAAVGVVGGATAGAPVLGVGSAPGAGAGALLGAAIGGSGAMAEYGLTCWWQ